MRSHGCSYCNLNFVLTFLGAFNQCYQRQSTSLFSCSHSIVPCHEKTTGIKSNILRSLGLALHFHLCSLICYSMKSQNHIVIWIGRDLKDWVPPPSVGWLPPIDQAAHSSFLPSLECLQDGAPQLPCAACAREPKDICYAFGWMLVLWLQQVSDLTSQLQTQLWDWDFLIHICANVSIPWLQKWYKHMAGKLQM